MKYCKNGFQLLPIITKHSILDVAAALDPHLLNLPNRNEFLAITVKRYVKFFVLV